MTPVQDTIHHDVAAGRFEIGIGDSTALIEYVRAGGRVTFVHTYVPPSHRGQGIAERLVRAALAWAREENLKVVPQCSYTARFIELHHDYADLLAPA